MEQQIGPYAEAVRFVATRLVSDMKSMSNEVAAQALYNTFSVTLSYPPMALFDLATYRRLNDLLTEAERTSVSTVVADGREMPLLYEYVVNYAIGLRIHLASLGQWNQLVSIIDETRASVQRSQFLLDQQAERLTADVDDPVYVLLFVMYEAIRHVNSVAEAAE